MHGIAPPPELTCDSETALICSNAFAAEVKGLKADSLTAFPKR
jgi:hypothetical protein